VIDFLGNGFTSTLLNFEVTSAAGAGRDLKVISRYNTFSSDRSVSGIRKFVEGNHSATHIIIHDPLIAVKEALRLNLPPNAVHLLARSGSGWQLAKSWPYPGYTEPHKMPD
jgi:hypothetical protein